MRARHARKKRPLIHRLFILILTPILLATNLLGTVRPNPLSADLRQYIAVMLPVSFADWLNLQLQGFSLPTLPPAAAQPVEIAASLTTPELPSPALTVTSTLTSTLTLTPTLTLTATQTSTPTITPTATLIPLQAGTWTFSWQYSPQYNTVWQDTFRIVQRGDRFLVTFVSDNYLGNLPVLSQNWDGKSLDFTYPNQGVSVNVHLKTLGIDSEGRLWVQVLSQWMGPPLTALPPVK